MPKLHLYHFNPHEFVRVDQYGNTMGWFDHMSPRLLVMIDILRYRTGGRILVSGHDHALGRQLGPEDTSQHNIDRWGEVRAADLMFPRIKTQRAARDLVRIAEEVGFTGIGVGPFWQPYFGMHVDVRDHRRPGDPATWGYIVKRIGEGSDAKLKQVTVSLDAALEAMPE